VERILSHYHMLLGMRRNNPAHPAFKIEGGWLGDGFSDFLERIPREHLLNQLYMFSERFDVSEAFDNILSCGHVVLVEEFNTGLAQLADKLGLPLRPIHMRMTRNRRHFENRDLDHLREMLEVEYRLYERVRRAIMADQDEIAEQHEKSVGTQGHRG
jgi:hypothetical protein